MAVETNKVCQECPFFKLCEPRLSPLTLNQTPATSNQVCIHYLSSAALFYAKEAVYSPQLLSYIAIKPYIRDGKNIKAFSADISIEPVVEFHNVHDAGAISYLQLDNGMGRKYMIIYSRNTPQEPLKVAWVERL
jgi:hypothetical protein